MPKFTVFTPSYNREHTLARVHDSLCRQSYKDFEWIIVDDGSTDHTKELVDSWIEGSLFPIKYHFQQNQGKHAAINTGLDLASGEFFLIADSDDCFTDTALMIFLETWESIPDSQIDLFTGVTGLCQDRNGKIIGDKFPSDPLDSEPAELYYHYGVKGEKWGFHRTEVLKQYRFPEPDDCKFIPEGVIWSLIGKHYKTRYINQVVRTYLNDSGNQLTKRDPIATSPVRSFYADILNNDIRFFFDAPFVFIKLALQYIRFSAHQSDSLHKQIIRLNSRSTKVLWLIALLPGYVLAAIDRINKAISPTACRIRHYQTVIRQQSKPIRFIISRVLWLSGTSHHFLIHLEGFKLHFYPSALSASYWVNPHERHGDESFLSNYLEPGNTYIDVGANIGALALSAANSVGKNGKVIAIEAHPTTFSYLQGNIKLNQAINIDAINIALGNSSGTITFSDNRSDDQNHVSPDGKNGIKVKMQPLDQLIESLSGTISLLKIDVEGYERFVFEGSHKTLMRTELIYFEAWNKHFQRFGYDFTYIFNLLNKYDFNIYQLTGNGLDLVDQDFCPGECINLFACKDTSIQKRVVKALSAP